MTEQANSAPGLTDEQRHELEVNGYVVLPELLSDDECDELGRLMDEAWQAGDYSAYGEPGVQFVRNALNHSPVIEMCVNHPAVLDAARQILGPDLRLHLINGRSASPGTGLQPLHDLQRPVGPPFEKCNVIWCLDEFTAANGATRVVPGTHLDRARFEAALVDPALPHPDERLVLAPRGSAIMHNSHLTHGGTQNRTTSARGSIHASFTRPSTPTSYDWFALPEHVRGELGPDTLALLGLPQSTGRRI